MKKENSGGSKNPKPRILGATPLQISEDDAAKLVGGIVEKGFSNVQPSMPLGPSTAPRPTLLPFPVARHRAHGPHWAPKAGNFNVINDNDDMDDDNGEEDDCDGMELAAGVANPVQRKERKDLDFSRWQEIMKKDCNSVLYEKKKEVPSTNAKEKNSDNLTRKIAYVNDAESARTSHFDPAKEHLMTMDDNASTVKEVKAGTDREMASAKEFHSFGHANNENFHIGLSKEKQVDLEMQHMQESPMSSGFAAQSVVGGEAGSLENQIDAENRARLAEMSPDEIVEAQAEIMAKLNPELINALKKRGLNKIKRQKFSSSADSGGEGDSMQQEKNLSKLPKGSDNTASDKPVKIIPRDTLKDKEDKDSPNISPQNCSTWDAWSKRVERVRDMRFSFGGNLISSGSAHASDTGKASSESGYNADNVSERDFLRTEGDPGAAGYTIKEAVALMRSAVPGQRTLALHLIAAVLDGAICSISENQVGSASEGSVDWEAIWAFALGPEPELALSLRIALDDNHDSVVLACAKAIQCALSCDVNGVIFDISEKTPIYAGNICTAPVFRSKPDVNAGFLRGGFWKYNTKPSNILCHGEDMVAEKDEGERTIQDDVVVAGQDFAAGLVRMGLLPRICYLLETDPAATLEECLISILIAIARHSPTCAAAVVDCERLVQTVASRFSSNEQMEINSCKIKSVSLLTVLASLGKKNCSRFIKNGIFRQVTWHLYRSFSLDQWIKSGKEACKLSSALLVKQLRIWKVFIQYGYCISDFSDLFPSLCIWLSVPTIQKLADNDVMNEYCAITKEAYLLVDVLAARLPSFYSCMHEKTNDTARDEETWSWSQFGHIIDLALEWIQLKSITYVQRLFDGKSKNCENQSLQDSEVNSFLWVISSALKMLSSGLKAVIPEDIMSLPNGRLPWLPDFIPTIGLAIIKNGYFSPSGVSGKIGENHLPKNGSILEYLCHLRQTKKQELAISSICCLQGLVRVVASVDKLIHHANLELHNAPSKYQTLSTEDKVLANGILKSHVVEVRFLLTTLLKLITKEWQQMQPVEMFGRGGPAPGVGVGWGAPSGGYWSLNTLLAQQDARLLIYLLETSEIIPFDKDQSEAGEMGFAMEMLNCALAACLIVGPGSRYVIDKLLTFIFEVPILKNLDFGIHQFLSLGEGYKPFVWNHEEEEYASFANVLGTHFRNRWLSVKKKRKSTGENDHVSNKSKKKASHSLETIHEDTDETQTTGDESFSLSVEWAHQRLPLPAHWFLSAISTVHLEKNPRSPSASYKETYDFLEVAKGGLFFLLGIEAMPTFLSSELCSPVKYVPIVWKLHAMSVILLPGMGVLEDEKTRDIYKTLQNIYSKILDEEKSLQFETDIHENYSTFIETLIDQFAAESYGDILFGRQIAVYLHRSVESPVRLATWNALSNARVLELLPRLDKCFTKVEGYLEPIEDNEKILEAYVKSWVSGALDKAATRSSMAFSLVMHHLSCFVFGDVAGDMLSLRNKLAKSLLRDYSCKPVHEGMMRKLICYKKPDMNLQPISETASSLPIIELERRLQLLKEICDANVTAVEKLESCIRREFIPRA